MWMFFGLATIGDPDRGVFIEVRPGQSDGEAELTHVNLFEDADDTGLVLLNSDTETCFDTLERLAEDLEADDGFVEQFEDDNDDSDPPVQLISEIGWVWLDTSHLFNVVNSAIITIGEGESDGQTATAVVFMTRHGGVVLFAGEREEAEGYLFMLAGWLGASTAIGDVAGELDVRGDLGQRAKA